MNTQMKRGSHVSRNVEHVDSQSPRISNLERRHTQRLHVEHGPDFTTLLKPPENATATGRQKPLENHRRNGGLMGFHGVYFLVGGLEYFCFFHILGIIIPIDYMIFFRGV